METVAFLGLGSGNMTNCGRNRQWARNARAFAHTGAPQRQYFL